MWVSTHVMPCSHKQASESQQELLDTKSMERRKLTFAYATNALTREESHQHHQNWWSHTVLPGGSRCQICQTTPPHAASYLVASPVAANHHSTNISRRRNIRYGETILAGYSRHQSSQNHDFIMRLYDFTIQINTYDPKILVTRIYVYMILRVKILRLRSYHRSSD